MKYLFLYCLIAMGFLAEAKPLVWHPGVVVLTNEKVETGEISLQGNHDLVLFRKGDTVSVYPAHKIKSLYFYDAEQNVNHKFVSVKERHVSHRVYHLYEIVLQGELGIWRKQTAAVASSDKFDFDYFVRYNEELIPLQHFRTKIYHELLKNSHDAMITFVSRENLDPNQPAHAIQIIEFYNQQLKQSAVALNY